MKNACTKVDGLKLKRRVTCPCLCWSDLTAKEQAENENSGNFFRFKGQVYDVGNIMRFTHEYWHGIDMQSAWSGILVHICNDNDNLVIASYYS